MDPITLMDSSLETSAEDREILEYLSQTMENEVAEPVITRRESADPSVLSFSQERVWFLQQMDPGTGIYNTAVAFRINGELDLPALQKSLDEVVRRHEMLRTVFELRNDNPVQRILEHEELPVVLHDFSAIDEAVREEQVWTFIHREGAQAFDLTRGPLLRVELMRMGVCDHILQLTMHHIVFDGWSLGVFMNEVRVLYEAFHSGEASPLVDLPIQYADFAIWQRAWIQGDLLEEQSAYWKAQLTGLRLLQLATDNPRPAVQTFRGARCCTVLSHTLLARLNKLGNREGATLFMTVLAAFQVLLHRYSGLEDIAVGTPIANRNRVEIEKLIGFFINTLVMRTDLSGNPSFRELLQRVREVALGAYAHQDLPFEKLVETLQPERHVSPTPLFQAMFLLQNAPVAAMQFAGIELTPVEVAMGAAKCDLLLAMEEGTEGLLTAIEYNADLFEAATIERMLEHLRLLLEAIVADPGQRIWDLPLLSDEEIQQQQRWNQTATEYPRDKTLAQLFEEQAAHHPEAIAVLCGEQRLSYGELNRRANQLAHYLRTMGVGAETRVGIGVERSLEMVVGLLGIVKAGAAYVPLDPSYPQERLSYMLQDAGVRVLLTQAKLAERWPQTAVPVLCLDSEWSQIELEPSHNPAPSADPENLAYVIYTSGSTGQPKGVAVTQRNIVRLVRQTNYVSIEADDTLLQFSPVTFDASTFEIWGALLNGARLAMYPAGALSLERMGEVLRQYQITTLWLTAGLFHLVVDEEVQALAGVRQLLAGGDVLSPARVEKVLREVSGCRVINGYGPTETTTFACCYAMTKAEQAGEPVPIGGPIANSQVHILDPHLRAVPVGIAGGELYIAGDGLARGYLEGAAATAEKFVPNPFSQVPGARMYRTGDRARWRPDGVIEFLGRLDAQVKIRGHRIEPGEVEALLMRHPCIQEAAVVVREEEPGEKRLVGYVVIKGEDGPTASQLRTYVKDRLPEYMVPSGFVTLAALPRTRSGKVDRQRLPEPEGWGHELEEAYEAPRTKVEEQLSAIWAEVELLGIEKLGIHDNFFELGGHSLMATRVLSRVKRAFDVDIPVRTLFEAPTVAGFAERVESAMENKSNHHGLPILRVERGAPMPLSFAQQRLWFLDQFEPGSDFYNLPSFARLVGELDVAALQEAANEIVRRHDTLRSTVSADHGSPVQVIAPSLNIFVPVLDLRRIAEPERECEAHRLAEEEQHKPFDLSRGPLLRMTLLQLSDRDHILLLTMHHFASDGWSLGVLFREMGVLYEAFHRGQSSPLADLPIQYEDYAVWQRSWLQGEVLEGQLKYWRKQLANLAALELTTDRPRPAVQTFRGKKRTMQLSRRLAERLRALSSSEGATLFMTVLAAFQVLLHRYSGLEDIAVGTPIANRNRVEIEKLIGFFINTLVMRTDLSGNPSFRELLQRVREVALGAYAHQDLPFEKLVEDLQPKRHLGRSPLFQVMFVLQNAPVSTLHFAGIELTPVEVIMGTAKCDLLLAMEEGAEGLLTAIEYNTDLFEAATIERMLEHLRLLLEAIVADPGQRIWDLPLLSDEEIQQQQRWNQTATEYPRDKTLAQLFEEQAAHHPEAIAVLCGEQRLSYGELNRRANQLAHYLRTMGVGAETRVGIGVERSLEMVVGLLGIVKAGAAYVPLDPSYPQERLSYMQQDAGVRVLLTQAKLAERWPQTAVPVLCLDSEWSQIELEPSHNPAPSADPENLAYVIYTSGSTGQPKGVAVTQRNIVRLVRQTNYVSIDADDTLLQFSPVTFDASTFEIWGALLNGARLAMYPAGALSLERMGEVLRQYQITTLWLTAGLFHLVVDEEVQALAGVRQLLAGGDVLSPARVEKVLREVSGCRVINGYGPTETTTFACCYAMTKAEQAGEPVPIGGPIANSQVHILDPHLRAVPVGIAGELYIAGDGLARGYLEGAAATAEKFVPNPFSQVPGARMYRTGDRARWRPDGVIEFLGRLDAQVKIRGHRIEPGEVEALLMRHPCIQEAAVVVREEEPGEKRLVGYVVIKGEDGPTASQLRTYVKDRLPEYMVPRRIVILDSIPLTSNGKLDRGLLPDDEDPAKTEPEATARPRGEMEAAIATVWQQVLHVDTMSLDDNFFDLGGHSLLILQVRRELREVLGRNIPIVDFFTYPSIRALVQHLDLGPQGPAAMQASRDDAGLRNDYLSRRKASSIRRQNHD